MAFKDVFLKGAGKKLVASLKEAEDQNLKEGEYGIMPAKGFCNLCSEEEIKNSIFYIFHLAKKVQATSKSKISS